jgi:hypothetical protein
LIAGSVNAALKFTAELIGSGPDTGVAGEPVVALIVPTVGLTFATDNVAPPALIAWVELPLYAALIVGEPLSVAVTVTEH